MSDKPKSETQRREFPQPNGEHALLNKWRDGNLKAALAAIAVYGGCVSNMRMAAVLGISPRGVRKHLRCLTNDPPGPIKCELRGNGSTGDDRYQPWFSLNKDFLPIPEVVPPLKPGLITYKERVEAESERDNGVEFKEDDHE